MNLSSDPILRLAQALVATAEALGQTLSSSAAKLMAGDLIDEASTEEIALALRDCRRTLTGRLTVAAVVERLTGPDCFPTANEAWAIALDSSDESRTAFITDEINRALLVARPVLDAGDKIGARMAFMDAYKRLVDGAQRQRRKAEWQLSLGWDAENREQVIAQAAIEGRITKAEEQRLIAQHCTAPLSTNMLLDDKQKPEAAAEALLHLDVLKNIVSFSSEKAKQARIMAAEVERKEFENHKAREIELLHEHHHKQEGVH